MYELSTPNGPLQGADRFSLMPIGPSPESATQRCALARTQHPVTCASFAVELLVRNLKRHCFSGFQLQSSISARSSATFLRVISVEVAVVAIVHETEFRPSDAIADNRRWEVPIPMSG